MKLVDNSKKYMWVLFGFIVVFVSSYLVGKSLMGSSDGENLNAAIDTITTNNITETTTKKTVTRPVVTVSPGDKVVTTALSPGVTVSPSAKPVSPSVSPALNKSPTPSPTASIKLTPRPSPSTTVSPSASPTLSPTVTPTPSETAVVTPTPTLPVGVQTATVFINEIAWMGTAASANDEWIEIYNSNDFAVDLSGWTLKSLTGTNPDPSIGLNGIISALGYYLLERTDDTTITDITADQIYTGALNNTCELLELSDNGGNLTDSVGCSDSWFAGDNITKASMERIGGQDGTVASSWATNNGALINGDDGAGNAIIGTPKLPNSQ